MMKQIKIKPYRKRQLDNRKTHPRETYDDVLKRVLEDLRMYEKLEQQRRNDDRSELFGGFK